MHLTGMNAHEVVNLALRSQELSIAVKAVTDSSMWPTISIL